MLKKRIIPCLDIKDGRVVKGVNFEGLRDAGNPVELAKFYSEQGADELCFLDITATVERRKTLSNLVTEIAKVIDIPFTVGGGISSVGIAAELIRNGADKISLNSAAVRNPKLIRECAEKLGSQAVVVAIDTKSISGNWNVFIDGGRTQTEWSLGDWAKTVEDLGAGEILLTSMGNDGTKSGFAIDAINIVSEVVNLPIIASGGAGIREHFASVFRDTEATAALAASVFHYREIGIPELKSYLKQQNIPIR